MSGDFRSFREIEHLREWFTVMAGDCSKLTEVQPPSPDATPTCPLMCSTHKCREGVEL